MKKITFVFLLFFTYAVGYAQLIKPTLSSGDFSVPLEKIVLDYPSNFRSIRVDSLFSQEDGYEMYGSSVQLPGSKDDKILHFHSTQDKTSAFQANFYEGDDFTEASKAYKNCIKQIKKGKIRGVKGMMSFNGEEAAPNEGMSFTVSTLRLSTDDLRYKGFCAEVELRGDVTGWLVQLNFHYKQSDTDGATE